MICDFCGFEIQGKHHVVKNGAKNACDSCWNNPEMFFPEKIQQDKRYSLLSEIAKSNQTNVEDPVEVKAIKLEQKNIVMYVGKMKVTDVLGLYELDKFRDEQLDGYQREHYEERTSQLVEYLEKSPLPIMPALLVGLRKTQFKQVDGDLGTLRIERKKGSLWIIDGQHRIGGFSKINDKFFSAKSLDASLFSKLMEFELPVVFIDSEGAAQKINNNELKRPLNAEDVEKTIFFIVNKTQRGISPSLKDALLYSIKTSGIDGLSIVDKEGWRIIGAEIGISLNRNETSPLRGKINVSGQRNSGKPIQLNSFVSSLEVLFKDKEFSSLSVIDQIGFLEAYWLALKELLPLAIEFVDEKPKVSAEEFGRRFASNIGHGHKKSTEKTETKQEPVKYMLLTALGIYTVHRIARDLLHMALQDGFNYKDTQFYVKKLEPLKTFDWTTKTSPIAGAGGMKGVSKAYELLSDVVKQEKYAIQKPISTH